MKNLELTEDNILVSSTGIWQIFVNKVKALFGFSRAIIGVFVLAQAALGAVLALKILPQWDVMIIGSIACITGSYSLVAYNDLLDVPIDRARLENDPKEFDGFDIGGAFERHPLAKGNIGYGLALGWIGFMALISISGIYYLKPSLMWILPLIALFVTGYSLLAMRSSFKTVSVAIAVTLGGVAGWLAVGTGLSLLFWVFVAWTFLWEIGGRNIPNDFNDVREDKKIGIKTVPVTFGRVTAAKIIMLFLVLTIIVSIPMAYLATRSIGWTLLSVSIGIYFLLIPGFRLNKKAAPELSLRLYNRSCFYPPAMLALLTLSFYI